MSIRSQLTDFLTTNLQQQAPDWGIRDLASLPKLTLQVPKDPSHGDFTTTFALSLARQLKIAPRVLAERYIQALPTTNSSIETIEVKGAGFINITIAPAAARDLLAQSFEASFAWLQSSSGNNEKILLEFISANPTGPLHVAHGRGAVLGDVLARMLRAAGYNVTTEYYINDQGRQIDVLAESLWIRYREALGETVAHPDDFYPGAYIQELAAELVTSQAIELDEKTPEERLRILREVGIDQMMVRIRADLAAFDVSFDAFVSERELTERKGQQAVIDRLSASGHLYQKDQKVWFRSTAFGDDKDRVVVRDDGRATYFLSDIIYHDDKLERGYARLINIWGADHGGYLTRVRAALQALGHDPKTLEVLFIQMVSLSSEGEAVRMGKRLGTAVWLDEVLREAGRDATRYLFLMRRAEAQMDFDLSLATRKSLDNPVFYAQMGHARLSAIARKAEGEGLVLPAFSRDLFDALVLPEEIKMMKAMSRASDVVADASETREPHLVIVYLQDLIAQFHAYYTKYRGEHRVVGAPGTTTWARLYLCRALQSLMAELLTLLGVDAPLEMRLETSANSEDSP